MSTIQDLTRTGRLMYLGQRRCITVLSSAQNRFHGKVAGGDWMSKEKSVIT